MRVEWVGMPRVLLLALALVLAAVLLPAPVTAAGDPAADPDCLRVVEGVDLQLATIPEMADAMAAGDLTSVELTQAYLDRIEAYEPTVNAMMTTSDGALERAAALDAERAAGQVRGPLHGIPVVLKDNVGTTDMPTTAGSIALEGATPERAATLTDRLEEAGAIILGKANLSEFAQWISLRNPNGRSSLGGQVVNAYDFDADPFGSSAGSGVAATMAFGAVTIGSETQGSIVAPAQASGNAALKPTVGLVSRAGIIPLAPAFDTAGPMGRTVTDLAVTMDAISGPDDRDPETEAAASMIPDGGFLAALDDTALEGVTLGVASGDRGRLLDVIEALEAQGATVVTSAALEDRADIGVAELATIPQAFHAALDAYLATEVDPPTGVESLEEVVAFNALNGVGVAQDLLIASAATPGVTQEPSPVLFRSVVATEVTAAFDEAGVDAFLAPAFGDYFQVQAAAGFPTVVLPRTYAGQRPQAVHLLGRGGSDADLLAWAHDLEQALDVYESPTALNPDLGPAIEAACAGAEADASPLGTASSSAVEVAVEDEQEPRQSSW